MFVALTLVRMYSWVGCLEPTCLCSRKRKMVLPSFFASNSSLISMVNKWLFTWNHSLHRKKKVREFPVPSRDVTTKLSLGGNNDVITELFLPRGSLVSDIPAGDRKLVNLFLRCTVCICPYYKSRVLMRMKNLSTLEKENSSLISIINKWLLTWKHSLLFLFYIFNILQNSVLTRMENLTTLENEKNAIMFYTP